jgi:hypothetical protein
MNSFLENLYAKVIAKLGSLASFIPMIASNLKKALVEGDIAKIKARTHELRELAAAQTNLANVIDDAVADGSIDLVEGSEIAIALERMIDEAEDVIKGIDEDDAPAE